MINPRTRKTTRRKQILLISAALILSASLTACGTSDKQEASSPSSSPSSPAPSSSQPSSPSATANADAALIQAFLNQAQSAATSAEVNQAFDESLAKASSPETGDALMGGLLAYYDKNLEAAGKPLEADKVQAQLQKLEWPPTDAKIAAIKDEATRKLVQDTLAGGYKLETAEGFYFPVVDYAKLSRAGDRVTPAMKFYVALLAVESNSKSAEDGGLVITWDELASRLLKTEDYIHSYPTTPEREKAEQLYVNYLRDYLLGLDNTPAYDNSTFKLDSKNKELYQRMIKEHPDTVTAKLSQEYLDLAAKNGDYLFKKGKDGSQQDIPDLKAFRDSLENHAKDLLDEANPNK